MKLLADSIQDVVGTVSPPPEVQPLASKGGAGGVNFLLNTAVTLLFEIAAVAFVFMFLWAALQWILSGGEKEKVAEARRRITWAIVGITLLAIAYFIFGVLGHILNVDFFAPR